MGPRKTSAVYQVQDHLLSLDIKKWNPLNLTKIKKYFMTINSLAHFQFQCLKKLIVIKDFHPGFFALCEGSGSFLYMYISILF